MTIQNCFLALKQGTHHKTMLDHVTPFTIQPRSDPGRLHHFGPLKNVTYGENFADVKVPVDQTDIRELLLTRYVVICFQVA
jgi:hypothetical protein